MTFLFRRAINKYLVTEADSLEEAVIKLFNRGQSDIQLEVIECPERMALTGDLLEVMHGVR